MGDQKKTFLRSGAASKNDRPEKKHSSVQARPPKMGHQKWFPSVLRRPRKMLHNNQRSRSGINLLRKIRDQKKNIPAFRCGHRKCSTRKNNKEQRHQTCVKKCATKQHIFWRSGVAIEHAKPENNILTFRCGHRKCATRKKKQDKEHATTGRYPKNARPEKNTLAFKGGHRTRPTRKLNNELWKHLLQQMRDQKKNTPPFRGGCRTSEIRTKTLPPSQTAAERPQSQDDLPGV